MVAARITLAGSVDDVHGRGVRVHQDHDGVRIDVGAIEIMLDRAAAYRLIAAISTATVDAAIYEVEQADDE